MSRPSNPVISILTPVWNRSAYLQRVWESIERQEYPRLEWVIANDGSTDDTATVCLELKRKSTFPITIVEANVRLGKARMDNELISNAKGSYLIWCDSDDYFLPGSISRLMNVWESIPPEEIENYIGLAALCTSKEGVLQSPVISSRIFDTTWYELDERYKGGDKLIFLNAKKIKYRRFIEVDFVVTESSLWWNYGDMKMKYIPEIMKIMDRGAENRISFSGKMEYCRGKAYSIAECEKIKPTAQGLNRKFLWKLVTYHRYCIHGDIELQNARNLWGVGCNRTIWFAAYTVGSLLALKDIIQRKVVKTHIEFERNRKCSIVRVVNDK